MEPEEREKLEKTYRRVVTIGWALLIDLVIFIVVVEIIRKGFAPFFGFSDIPNPTIIRYLFFGLALFQYFFMHRIANIPLKKYGKQANWSREECLRLSVFITYAFCELPAVLGLVLFLLSGFYLDFYIFIFLSLFYLMLFFPRFHEWETWFESQPVHPRGT